jgi:hypothetical protein
LVRLAALRSRLSKKKWSDGIDIRRLSGEMWLRLLTRETDVTAFVGWCVRCRTGKCLETTCRYCGEALLLFDEQFWVQISHKIQLALQKDRALLSRVKSERENLYGTRYQPRFPGPLEWLFKLWEKAPRPSHRSFDQKAHYLVANCVESLQRLGLSKEETVDVLNTVEFPNGQIEWQGKDYAKIPGEDLRTIGQGIRRAVGEIPGSAIDMSEMIRTMAWVDRQRSVPMARLRGERVRMRSPARD